MTPRIEFYSPILQILGTAAATCKGLTIADVLGLTAVQACVTFADEPKVLSRLELPQVGLGYLGLCQPATELRAAAP